MRGKLAKVTPHGRQTTPKAVSRLHLLENNDSIVNRRKKSLVFSSETQNRETHERHRRKQMTMFKIHNDRVKMMRDALTMYAFTKPVTVLDMLKEVADDADLDENHPLVQAIGWLDDAIEGNPPTDQARAVATLNLHNLCGFQPVADPDLVNKIENRAHRYMEAGNKIRYGEESKILAGVCDRDPDPLFDLAVDAAMVKIKADPRVVRLNGNGEEMGGKGRWTEIAHKGRYQITAAS